MHWNICQLQTCFSLIFMPFQSVHPWRCCTILYFFKVSSYPCTIPFLPFLTSYHSPLLPCHINAPLLSTLSYAQYSVIAARAVRQALKEPLRVEAAKRDGSQIKIIKWKDGKAISKYLLFVVLLAFRLACLGTRFSLFFSKTLIVYDLVHMYSISCFVLS